MESLDSLPSWFEKFESTQRELIEEIAKAKNDDNFWRKRLEQLALASYMRDLKAVADITSEITGEHLRDKLRAELASYQRQLSSYQRDTLIVKERVAKQGYPTIEQSNQLDDWQREIDKLTEAIERMREALK